MEKTNMKETMEIRKDKAAGVLVDEIWAIKQDVKKADLMIRELFSNFFDKYDVHDQQGRAGIICEFEMNKTYADIISDYVFKAKQSIENLEKRAVEENI